MTITAGQRLNTPDLLLQIFVHADKLTLTRCLRVCQSFYENAGPILYAELRIKSHKSNAILKGATSRIKKSTTGQARSPKATLLSFTRTLWISNYSSAVDAFLSPRVLSLFSSLNTVHISAAPATVRSRNPTKTDKILQHFRCKKLLLHSFDGWIPWPRWFHLNGEYHVLDLTIVVHEFGNHLPPLDFHGVRGYEGETANFLANFRILMLGSALLALDEIAEMVAQYTEKDGHDPTRPFLLIFYDLISPAETPWNFSHCPLMYDKEKQRIEQAFSSQVRAGKVNLVFKSKTDYLSEGCAHELDRDDMAMLHNEEGGEGPLAMTTDTDGRSENEDIEAPGWFKLGR